MVELSKENFEQEVLKADGLVMVDFWSQKCEPCKELSPILDEMAERNAGKAKFCSLDITNNKRLAISQKVLGLPTIIFYQNGEMVAAFSKDISVEDVEVKLNELA
jgi:thioredoxin 1